MDCVILLILSGLLEYSLTLCEIASILGDSHATVVSSALNDHMGTHVPPIELKTVEDKTVVSFTWKDQQTEGLPLGVEILTVDIGNGDVLLR